MPRYERPDAQQAKNLNADTDPRMQPVVPVLLRGE